MRDFCPSAKTLGFSEAVYGAINAENAIHVLRTAKQKARSKRRVEGKRKVQTREEANRPATNSSQAGSGEDVLEGPFNPASILPSASCNTARILRLGDALPAPPLMASFAHNAQLADGMAEAFHIENGPMDWLNQVLCPLPHAPPEPLPSTPPSMGLDYVPGVSIYPETRLWHETNPTALGGLDLWEEYYSSGFGAACGSSVPSNLWDSLPSGEEHRDLLIPYSF
ncbi:uncharacterized protein PHACADRAFT_255831 [Phanerochaete carnosa HHB-10118-sp]|uniref:Uncharacterized protein n=1 Tax=Phanerochaete carnosa (strain HHB-10118-sp) TaxID=650164 RepID=K5W839_PHACS|nr:uncharacterized protein PHACADRAFT_255831 [Phanerochaete carnosa HHB-10118-sp]EKM55305.1 hypothetical protein PHACADRAFT_255831 [Phanerochaete carnosa HHB-10118-sp]